MPPEYMALALPGFSGPLCIKVVVWRWGERLGPPTPDAILISERELLLRRHSLAHATW